MRELVRHKADIIIAFGPEAPLKEAMAATRTIPIVMMAIDFDPIARGYVSSLARPTGNVTGVMFDQIELAVKRLQLLNDAFPEKKAAVVFWDQPSADQWHATETNAARFGLRIAGVELSNYPYDYERALMQKPTLSGRIAFDWTVSKTGSVKGVRVRSSTLGSPQVATCISKLIKRWKFPRPKGGEALITFPFLFRVGS